MQDNLKGLKEQWLAYPWWIRSLVFLSLLFLWFWFLSNRLAWWGLGRVNDIIRGSIQVEDLSVLPWQATAKNIVLQGDDGDVVMEAKKVKIGLDSLAFLTSGNYGDFVGDITIQDFDAALKILADGRIPLITSFVPQKSTPLAERNLEKSFLRKFDAKVRLEQGSFHLEDYRFGVYYLALSDFSGLLEFVPEGLLYHDLEAQIEQGQPGSLNLDGHIDLVNYGFFSRVRLDQLLGTTVNGFPGVPQELYFTEGFIDADVTLRGYGTSWSEVLSGWFPAGKAKVTNLELYYPVFQGLLRAVNGDLNIQGWNGTFTTSDFNLADGQGQAEVTWGLKPRMFFEVACDIKEAVLEQFLEDRVSFVYPITGLASGHYELIGDEDELTHYFASKNSQLKVGPFDFDQVSGEVTFNSSSMLWEKLSGLLKGQSPVIVSGMIGFSKEAPAVLRVEGSDIILTDLGLPYDGRLEVDGTYWYDSHGHMGLGDAKLDGVNFQGQSAMSLEGLWVADEERLAIADTTLDLWGERLPVNFGSYAFADRGFSLGLKPEDFSLYNLGYSGSVTGDFWLAGDLEQLDGISSVGDFALFDSENNKLAEAFGVGLGGDFNLPKVETQFLGSSWEGFLSVEDYGESFSGGALRQGMFDKGWALLEKEQSGKLALAGNFQDGDSESLAYAIGTPDHLEGALLGYGSLLDSFAEVPLWAKSSSLSSRGYFSWDKKAGLALDAMIEHPEGMLVTASFTGESDFSRFQLPGLLASWPLKEAKSKKLDHLAYTTGVEGYIDSAERAQTQEFLLSDKGLLDFGSASVSASDLLTEGQKFHFDILGLDLGWALNDAAWSEEFVKVNDLFPVQVDSGLAYLHGTIDDSLSLEASIPWALIESKDNTGSVPIALQGFMSYSPGQLAWNDIRLGNGYQRGFLFSEDSRYQQAQVRSSGMLSLENSKLEMSSHFQAMGLDLEYIRPLFSSSYRKFIPTGTLVTDDLALWGELPSILAVGNLVIEGSSMKLLDGYIPVPRMEAGIFAAEDMVFLDHAKISFVEGAIEGYGSYWDGVGEVALQGQQIPLRSLYGQQGGGLEGWDGFLDIGGLVSFESQGVTARLAAEAQGLSYSNEEQSVYFPEVSIGRINRTESEGFNIDKDYHLMLNYSNDKVLTLNMLGEVASLETLFEEDLSSFELIGEASFDLGQDKTLLEMVQNGIYSEEHPLFLGWKNFKVKPWEVVLQKDIGFELLESTGSLFFEGSSSDSSLGRLWLDSLLVVKEPWLGSSYVLTEPTGIDWAANSEKETLSFQNFSLLTELDNRVGYLDLNGDISGLGDVAKDEVFYLEAEHIPLAIIEPLGWPSELTGLVETARVRFDGGDKIPELLHGQLDFLLDESSVIRNAHLGVEFKGSSGLLDYRIDFTGLEGSNVLLQELADESDDITDPITGGGSLRIPYLTAENSESYLLDFLFELEDKDASWLEHLVPGAIESEGSLAARVAVAGTLDDFRYSGNAVLEEGEVELSWMESKFEDLSLELAIEEPSQSLVVNQLSGSFGGGNLEGGGLFGLSLLEAESQTDFSLALSESHLVIPDVVDAKLSLSAEIKGDPSNSLESALLKGDVIIHSGDLYLDSSEEEVGEQKSGVAESEVSFPFLSSLPFDYYLDVHLGNNFWGHYLDSFMRGIGDIVVYSEGELKQPLIRGDVEVSRGVVRFSYYDSSFKIRQGWLRFSDSLYPVVDALQADSSIGLYQLIANVEGDAETGLSLNIRAEPPLQNVERWSLVVGTRDPVFLASPGPIGRLDVLDDNFTTGRGVSILTSVLTNQVSDGILRALRLSEVTLNYFPPAGYFLQASKALDARDRLLLYLAAEGSEQEGDGVVSAGITWRPRPALMMQMGINDESEIQLYLQALKRFGVK